MVLWSDIDVALIESVPSGRDRTLFRYKGGPLRFQIPRGACPQGVSEYKSFQVEVTNRDFLEWWSTLEAHLCTGTPFNSNLKNGSLRLKIDDAVYIFDQNSKQITPDVREGLFRGQELACLIDIVSTYFFNGSYGLTVRTYQVKTLTEPEVVAEETAIFSRGSCAFLPESA